MSKSNRIQSLLDQIIEDSLVGRPHSSKIEDQLRELMKFDKINLEYFIGLYKKYKNSSKHNIQLEIHEGNTLAEGDHPQPGIYWSYPTATAPLKLMKELPCVDYSDLLKRKNSNSHKRAVLWIKKMQAGIGSSIVRKKYLSKIFGVQEDKVKNGAKGTDLFLHMDRGNRLSIAEIQILQAFKDADDQKFGKVVFQDIISAETEKSINEIWNRHSFIDRDKTYKLMLGKLKYFNYFGKTFQAFNPTIDTDNRISFNRVAPGGHALFGIDALMAALDIENDCPQIGENQVLIGSIGNGEDLCSSPDQAIVRWMVEESVPLVMITTTKTRIDKKGGQISLVPEKNEGVFIDMVEKAQAESAGQLELFEKLGLRAGDNKALFNTNVVLINYNAFAPKLANLCQKLGRKQLIDVIMPHLIINGKKQIDEDNVERQYLQLEGALGSVILNLDKYWRKNFNEPLVTFLNIDVNNRTKFFLPIKTAFDYFLQFHSDRFDFDFESYRPVDNRPGHLPEISLESSYYKEVQNVLDSFKGCKVLELDSLSIVGKVQLPGIKLSGRVKIVNKSPRIVNLSKLDPSIKELGNCLLCIDENRDISTESWPWPCPVPAKQGRLS